jgi:hypothetical protein
MDDRKTLFASAKNNLKGEGILLKKLPVTLLKRYADKEEDKPVPEELEDTIGTLEELNVIPAIRSWVRGGMPAEYLEELTQGMGWVKHGNFVAAFKQVGGEFQVVGFVVYGTFNPKRSASQDGESRSWTISFTPALDVLADDAAVAEVEYVITKPAAAGAGVGRALLEYALSDCLARKKAGAPRYEHAVLFTGNPKMEALARGYGFARKSYKYADAEGRNVTASRVREGYADPVGDTKAYVWSEAGMRQALESTENRVVSARVCPLPGGTGKLWGRCI